MDVVSRIQKLNEPGYSKKSIALDLGMSRNTVKEYHNKQPTHGVEQEKAVGQLPKAPFLVQLLHLIA